MNFQILHLTGRRRYDDGPTDFLGMISYLEAVLNDLTRKPAYPQSGPDMLLLKNLGKFPGA